MNESSEYKVKNTILIVDDDDMVRNVTMAMISSLGYKTIVVNNGDDAIKMFNQYKDEICCVLSDLTLPNMNGFQILTTIQNISPGIPTIITSGRFCQDVFDGKPELLHVFLHKPYTIKNLEDALIRIIK